MRNALAYAGKSGKRVVSAFIATAFAQDSADAAKAQWRKVADQLRPTLPKLAVLMDEAESDVLAYMTPRPPGSAQRLPRPRLGDAGRTVELRIPKLRKGSYFPGFLEPRRLRTFKISEPNSEAAQHAETSPPG